MKITNEQFETFKSYCFTWINRFGLSGWHVKVVFKNDVLEGGISDIFTSLEMRRATITLNTECEEEVDNKFLYRIALHECLHLLLKRMKNTFYKREADNYDDSEHEAIRSLENYLTSFKDGNVIENE